MKYERMFIGLLFCGCHENVAPDPVPAHDATTSRPLDGSVEDAAQTVDGGEVPDAQPIDAGFSETARFFISPIDLLDTKVWFFPEGNISARLQASLDSMLSETGRFVYVLENVPVGASYCLELSQERFEWLDGVGALPVCQNQVVWDATVPGMLGPKFRKVCTDQNGVSREFQVAIRYVTPPDFSAEVFLAGLEHGAPPTIGLRFFEDQRSLGGYRIDGSFAADLLSLQYQQTDSQGAVDQKMFVCPP